MGVLWWIVSVLTCGDGLAVLLGKLTAFLNGGRGWWRFHALWMRWVQVCEGVRICTSWSKAIFLHEHIWAIGLVVS